MSKQSYAGFTFVDLCIVVALLIIFAAVLLPMMARQNHSSHRLNCVYNLKRIGISFLTWSLDNTNRFPMQVPVSEGGTMGLTAAFVNFEVMSNELSIPTILVCPLDQQRSNAANFFPDLNNRKISYFVGLDAELANSSMILCGDRNITNGLAVRNGLLELAPNRPSGWTHELHEEKGNILLVDGSVQQLTTPRLRQLISDSVAATNRLAMP